MQRSETSWNQKKNYGGFSFPQPMVWYGNSEWLLNKCAWNQVICSNIMNEHSGRLPAIHWCCSSHFMVRVVYKTTDDQTLSTDSWTCDRQQPDPVPSPPAPHQVAEVAWALQHCKVLHLQRPRVQSTGPPCRDPEIAPPVVLPVLQVLVLTPSKSQLPSPSFWTTRNPIDDHSGQQSLTKFQINQSWLVNHV